MKKNNLNNLIIFLKRAGLFDEAREVGELANSGLLYHGSTVGGLKTLKPMSSAVLGGESAVFATPERWMAISHIGSWTDSDIEQGVINGEPYMLEKKEGAFDRAYNSDSPGSLYSVSSEDFSSDSRLMREERIRAAETNVIDEEKIIDPLSEMESLGVKLIRADEAEKFYKDNFLEDWVADLEFQSYDKKGQVSKEAVLLRKASIEGTIPDFAWLYKGLMLDLKEEVGERAFNEFIELNSDKFAVWNPIEYLGSGMVGSAWLLDDGKVLKIFDGRARVFNESDYSKYERIMEDQFEGKSNPNVPMVYELGDLEIPNQFRSVPSPSRKSSGYFDAKYVIMESLETPGKMVKKHIAWNPYLDEPALRYDEENDEWVEREVDENKEVLSRMDRSEVPPELLEDYDEAVTYDDYGEYERFLNKFITFMWHEIISYMSEAYNESPLDPSDPNYKELMIDSLESSIGKDDYSLKALEEILNVTPGWRRRLAESVFDNLQMGRKDLHGGNFGFRNGKFVFFDA